MHFSLFILLLLLNFSLPSECWNCDVGAWLDIPANVAHGDAIVVLGGDSQRLPVATALFHEGYAPELWYTGATEAEQAGSDSSVALQMASDMGVPVEAMTLLATTSTWEDGREIAAAVQARGARSILVVTSWYHGRRALCAINHHLQDDTVQVYYQPVATLGFGPDDWWLSEAGKRVVTSELYKILFYWGNYGLVPWLC